MCLTFDVQTPARNLRDQQVFKYITMHSEKILPLAKGLIKKIVQWRKYDKSTGGTNDSRYCYSVWMRHLVFAYNNGVRDINGTVAELGPGDSLGIGFAALLTGCEKYYAMDVHKYWDVDRNLRIFDELVELVQSRAAIPGEEEFPRVTPALPSYAFPHHILPESRLHNSLSPERIELLRSEIGNLDTPEDNTMVKYFIPWNDHGVIEDNTVDFIYSQAVLQYVNDLDGTYKTMHKWLKPGGFMSHSIDFSSHGITDSWNGHWLFSDAEWKLIHANNKVILNRAPRSHHLDLTKKHHFEVVNKLDYRKKTTLSGRHFHKKYSNLSQEDIDTHVMVVQARKMMVPGMVFFQSALQQCINAFNASAEMICMA